MKCNDCKYYIQPFVEKGDDDAVCGSPDVQAIQDPNNESHLAPMIETARDYCDKEGDGKFVYFTEQTND